MRHIEFKQYQINTINLYWFKPLKQMERNNVLCAAQDV